MRYGPRPPVSRKLDAYRGIIESRLAEYPELTAKRIYDEIRAAGYAGGYTQGEGGRASRATEGSRGASRAVRNRAGSSGSGGLRGLEGLEEAFGFFGGVPSELLFDQLKAVIVADGRSESGRVTENAEFVRFAHHWGFRVRACRPYRAKTKGEVERPVCCVRKSFFYGRVFTSDSDLNAQSGHWLEHVANARVHGTLKERR